MTKDIAKKQMCLVTFSGMQIWLDADKATKLQADMDQGINAEFIRVEGRTVKLAGIDGLFLPEDIDGWSRRKNGQWKCTRGSWHDRGQECNCPDPEKIAFKKAWEKAVKKCDKGCTRGYLTVKRKNGQENITRYCDCVKHLVKDN